MRLETVRTCPEGLLGDGVAAFVRGVGHGCHFYISLVLPHRRTELSSFWPELSSGEPETVPS
jgi:hypothetical protein